MDVHPDDLEPNSAGLRTAELPVGTLYSNYEGWDVDDPPAKIIEKLDDRQIVIQDVDPVTGVLTGTPLTLSSSGSWQDFVPALVALPDPSRPERPDPEPSEAQPKPWHERLRNALYRTRWQVAISATIGACVGLISALLEGEADYTPLESLGDYLGFALGISSVLALVASITFGFLLHHLQSVTAEKHMLYASFKARVDELRHFLDDKYQAGIIDRSYDFQFGVVEEITLKDFPIMDFGDRIEATIDTITEDQREELEEAGEFGPILRGLAYRVNDIEETVQGLLMVFFKEVATVQMLAPVVKAFQTLVVVILTVLVALVHYGGILKTVLFAAGIGLGLMAMLLILELAMVARREARELHGMSLLDGER